MKPVLVLGVGNRLMMDDGIGVAVVEALAGQEPPVPSVRYAVGETDFEYCLDLAAQADVLVIVDAAETGKSPGEVSLFPLGEIAARRPGLSLHHLHFLDLLVQLDSPKRGVLIGIQPGQIEFHWGLSVELEEQFEEILSRVRAAIAEALEE